MSLARTIDFLRHLPRPNIPHLHRTTSALTEAQFAGSNPGNLRMFSYVPTDLPADAALVVVLHGCTQSAQGYDVGAGWSVLAERYGFALLMPEQQTSNNPNRCFNWFEADDIKRGSGEAFSIRQMVEQMTQDHRINRRRIYITGLSAGGAMTSVMLATYPDVFSGGAIIAGLPFGAAANLQEALRSMFTPASRSPEELGDMVRMASPHRGPWPRVSVWHGSADRTVSPSNADETIKQWLDVHDLPLSPMSSGMVDNYPRQVWWNADGETVLESFTITNMQHGTPLGSGDDDEKFGEEGAYLIAAGISSSFHIANFFGLTERIHTARQQVAKSKTSPAFTFARPPIPAPANVTLSRKPASQDIGKIIKNALTAAGLMK